MPSLADGNTARGVYDKKLTYKVCAVVAEGVGYGVCACDVVKRLLGSLLKSEMGGAVDDNAPALIFAKSSGWFAPSNGKRPTHMQYNMTPHDQTSTAQPS